MPIINITVREKIAERAAGSVPSIVSGNSDYVAVFDFDDEWDELGVKTARFIVDGEYTDVVFEGNECAIPVIKYGCVLEIGVYAGDIHTTTSAEIAVKPSVTSEGEEADAPKPDVYAQIMEILNELIRKGGAGSGAVLFVPQMLSDAEKAQARENIGADALGSAEKKAGEHNVSLDAHRDIRILISEMAGRLNALANSTDEDLDQMAEIVEYIKSNKALIDEVTTKKVNVHDIVNNLTTNVAQKPLSAAQGVALKALLDEITVPTKVSELQNDAGYIKSFTESDPSVPAWAKAASKPSYTKSEVGLGNVDNVKQYSASNPPPYPVSKVNGKTGAVTLGLTDMGLSEETWTFTLEDGSTVTKRVVLAATETTGG